MRYFLERPYDYYLILSGDQLYRMDLRTLLHQHIRSGADITLATKPVGRARFPSSASCAAGVDRRVTRFVEKPKDEGLLNEMQMSDELLGSVGASTGEELYQASMGIYLFNRDVLVQCLANDLVDFGKHIIPQAIKERHVSAHIFQGYWEDIGTIRAFYEANLDLTDIVPEYSFFDAQSPIYTHPRFLPGSKVNGATLRQAIISDGCIISDAHLERSVIGIRSIIRSGATIRNSIVMGADYFESDRPADPAYPPLGHRTQLRDRSRDHRQECAHRRWSGDHAGREAAGFRRRELFYSRRNRGRPEGQRDSLWFLDLGGLAGSGGTPPVIAAFPEVAPTFSLTTLRHMPRL